MQIIGVLWGMRFKKVPFIAKTIDWDRAVFALALDIIDGAVVVTTLGVALKHQAD